MKTVYARVRTALIHARGTKCMQCNAGAIRRRKLDGDLTTVLCMSIKMALTSK